MGDMSAQQLSRKVDKTGVASPPGKPGGFLVAVSGNH
jgi:hypothetical protein